MRLILQPQPDMTSATLPIRWCLDHDEFKRAEENRGKAFVLIVVVSPNGQEERYLVPVNQALEYIQFHYPGLNRVFATIVTPKRDYDVKRMHGDLLSHNQYGGYENRVFKEYEGNLQFRDADNFTQCVDRISGSTEVPVPVAEEFFAKDPPAWLEWWVNLWYETKQRDECHLRKRAILAFTAQPPVIAVYLLIRALCGLLAACWFLFLGFRGVSLAPIIHPFRHGFGNIWSNRENSVWFHKKNGDRRNLWISLLNPPVIGVMFGIVFATNMLFAGGALSLKMMLLITIGASIIGIPIVIVLMALILWVIDRILEGTKDVREERRQERERKVEERKRLAELQQRAYREDLLVCNVGLKPSISSLPRKQRTVHLLFYEVKSKICRPYAG